MAESTVGRPLEGLRVVELSRGVAAAYASRLLATFGAEVTIVEPPAGHPLRREPPFLPESEATSALFCYLGAGKRSVVLDFTTSDGKSDAEALIDGADVFLCDFPLDERAALGLDEETTRERRARLVYVSVLPFGARGPKARWSGEEINLIHAAGEGFLLPNGLSTEMFPDRPPLKIHGHFAEMQGGIVAAMGALAAVLATGERGEGQAVDISIQDATLSVGAFAVQRYGDGSLEHRSTRSFKYGGVLECADGYLELLTLEDRQWEGLVELMESPAWAIDPVLRDPLERSRRGAEINAEIRAWAKTRRTSELVSRAQRLGVPMAKYASPAEVLGGEHERERELFQAVEAPGFGPCLTLVSPFHIYGAPLTLSRGAPALDDSRARAASRKTTRQIAEPR
jgi:crotonobetainyl-CoA:carnitine CoA-transferase CaiB-like acyl-CoA transferase